jgi:hypothetical protein
MVRLDSVVDYRAWLTEINLLDQMFDETSAIVLEPPKEHVRLQHMSLTATRHPRRSIAFTMLFVWVFALLSGVANACLTESRGEQGHARLHAPPPDHAQQMAPEGHAADAKDRRQHDQDADKAPCQKSCDGASQTLLKQLPKFDAHDLQAVALPTRAWAEDVRMAPPGLGRAALAAVPPATPPARLQFSRLAL